MSIIQSFTLPSSSSKGNSPPTPTSSQSSSSSLLRKWNVLEEEAEILANRAKEITDSYEMLDITQLIKNIKEIEKSYIQLLAQTKDQKPPDGLKYCTIDGTNTTIALVEAQYDKLEELHKRLPDLMIHKARRINEEGSMVVDAIERLINCEKYPELANLDDASLLKLISYQRKKLSELQEELAAMHRELPTHQLLIGSLTPFLKNEFITELINKLDNAETRHWGYRHTAAREHLQRTKAVAYEDINKLIELSDVAGQSPVLDSPKRKINSSGRDVLDPRPSSKHTDLESLKSALNNLEMEEAISSSDAVTLSSEAVTEIGVSPSEDHRLKTEKQQMLLQLEFRRYEGKLFENEHKQTVSQPELIKDNDYIGRELTEEDKKFLTEYGPTLFARVKHEAKLPVRYDITQSQILLQQAQNSLQTTNAIEQFKGVTSQQMKKSATVEAFGIRCLLVPKGIYKLGHKELTTQCTLLDVANSIDRSSRLDRRTNYWLSSKAPLIIGGTRYNDGPQHFMFTTRQRTVDLGSYYVSTRPVTVKQFLNVTQSTKFRNAMMSVMMATPKSSLEEKKRPVFTPSMFQMEIERFIEKSVSREFPSSYVDGVARGIDIDETIEVPYFVAEAFCAVLGGIVCSVDIWEVMCCGADENRDFLEPRVDFESDLGVKLKFWKVPVDANLRVVLGSSWRISDQGKSYMRALTGPFKHEWIGRGFEWNSSAISDPSTDTHDPNEVCSLSSALRERNALLRSAEQSLVPKKPWEQISSPKKINSIHNLSNIKKENHEWIPVNCHGAATHVLRSCLDHNTQLIFSGTSYSQKEDAKMVELVADEREDYSNENAFSAPSLRTFSLPHHGVAVAAFRLAIPACSFALKQTNFSLQRLHRCSGRHISYKSLMGSFGGSREKLNWLKGVEPEQILTDSADNRETWVLAAAGIDLVWGSEVPYPLEEIILYHPHNDLGFSVVERWGTTLSVLTDSIPSYTLPLSGKTLYDLKSWLRDVTKCGRLCSILEDTSTRFAYVDQVTIPDEDPMLPNLVFRVRVEWRVKVSTQTLEKIVSSIKISTVD